MKKVLLVINAQNDYYSNGINDLPNAIDVTKNINKNLRDFDLVIFTMAYNHNGNKPYAYPFDDSYNILPDTLEKENFAFDVCLADTVGAEISSNVRLQDCKKDFYFFKYTNVLPSLKNTKSLYIHSVFNNFNNKFKSLLAFLIENDVSDLYISGFIGEYECADTALDARANFNVHFLTNSICFFYDRYDDSVEKCIKRLRHNGVFIYDDK